MIKPIFKNRNYMIFISGQCFSFIGNWMQKVALSWTAYELTGSSLVLGMAGLFQYTPAFLLSLFMGGFVDHFPKRSILITTQSVLAVLCFMFAALTRSGFLEIWHVYALCFVMGTINALEFPARHSFQGELCERREDVVDAIALNWTASNIGRIVGPAIAGLCLSTLGAAVCFALNGISNIFAIAGLLPVKNYNGVIRRERKNAIGDTIDGFKYILSHTTLSHATLAVLVVGLFANNTEVILPVFTDVVLGKTAAGYSIMMSAMGFGALAASLMFITFGKRLTNKLTISLTAFGLAVLAIGLSANRNYYIAVAILALIGLCWSLNFTAINSALQFYSSDAYRSRAMCVYTFVCTGTSPVGNFFTGLVSHSVGSAVTYAFCGVTTILFLIPVQLRTMILKRKGECNEHQLECPRGRDSGKQAGIDCKL